MASGKEKNEIEEIYEKYYKDVYRFVLALSKNPHIAEDITQETFVKAIKAVDRFKGDCDIKVWLCLISETVDKEQAIKIHRILHDLPEPYKEVFTLRVFGELRFGQIADIFGKTESWARVTYHRARMMIMDKM